MRISIKSIFFLFCLLLFCFSSFVRSSSRTHQNASTTTRRTRLDETLIDDEDYLGGKNNDPSFPFSGDGPMIDKTSPTIFSYPPDSREKKKHKDKPPNSGSSEDPEEGDDEDDDTEDPEEEEFSGDGPSETNHIDNKDIIIDGPSKSPSDFIPIVESSTKKTVPSDHHDFDSEDDEDSDDLPEEKEEDEDEDQDIHDVHDVHDKPPRFNNDISMVGQKQASSHVSFLAQSIILAAVIGGIVVSLLCAILLTMFIIIRTRKKDEGSYICEPSLTSPVISHYGKGSSNKFYDP